MTLIYRKYTTKILSAKSKLRNSVRQPDIVSLNIYVKKDEREPINQKKFKTVLQIARYGPNLDPHSNCKNKNKFMSF